MIHPIPQIMISGGTSLLQISMIEIRLLVQVKQKRRQISKAII